MQRSAGVLAYRFASDGTLEVLLVHPGGPWWAKKDDGAWSIPKGEYEEGSEPRAVAEREFAEELGSRISLDDALELGEIRQRGGKVVRAWAVQHDLDPSRITSNSFTIEWPPRSGKFQEFPEIDKAAWFEPSEARRKINSAQAEFIDRLIGSLGSET
ncbi:MAG: NUDIX domain-containing protein [Acidothermus sp.]|nr:NUDIX domain-containing protein [Acidothermus sp.]